MSSALQADCLLAEPQPAMWEYWVRSLGQGDPLEREMATHSSILAWRIPWMEEPDGLVHRVTKSRTRLGDFTSHYVKVEGRALGHTKHI